MGFTGMRPHLRSIVEETCGASRALTVALGEEDAWLEGISGAGKTRYGGETTSRHFGYLIKGCNLGDGKFNTHQTDKKERRSIITIIINCFLRAPYP